MFMIDRPPLGGRRSRTPLVCAINGLASKQPSLSDAVQCLSKCELSNASEYASKALTAFRSQSNKEGQVEAKSILISCSALESSLTGSTPMAAYDMAVEAAAEATKADDSRGEAYMNLAVAELGGCLAKGSRDFEDALAKAEESLSTFQDAKDKRMEACSQLVISSLNCRRQRAIEAQQAANAALMMFMDIDDKVGQAKAFHSLALASLISDDFENAIKSAKMALAIYKEQGSKWAQVVVLHQMAQWYMMQDKPQKSLKLAKDALAIVRGLGCNKRFEAALLLVLAEALFADGHGKRALKVVQEGVELLRKAGDKSALLAGLQVLMHVHIMLESAKEALEAAYEAKELVNSLGDKRMEIDYLHSKSKSLLANGEKDLAASSLRDAAEIAKSLDDFEEEAEAMKAIAMVYSKGSVAEKAVDEARSICQDAGDALGEASALLLKGSMLLKNNANADEILGEVEEARNLCQDVEDIAGEAAALKMMVDCYVGKRDFESAMEAASDCVELHKQLGKKRAQAEAMCSIVNIHLQEGESVEVYEVIDDGIALAKEVGATGVEARLLLLLAQVCVMALQAEEVPKGKAVALTESFSNLRDKAFKATKDALSLSSKCGDRGTRASALFWHAELLVWCFRSGEAVSYAEDAENLFAKLNDSRGRAHAKVLLADLQLMHGKKVEAKALAEDALEMVKDKAGCEDAESALNQVLERINRKDAVPMMSGGRRMVQKMVKKRRKKGGGGGGGAVAKLGLDKNAALAKVLALAKAAVTDEDDMAADIPFMEAGIDSLGSVQFVTDASREFALNLPPSVVFDFPTVRSLSEHLLEESGGGGGGAAEGGGGDEWEDYEELEWVEEDVPFEMIQMAAAPTETAVAVASGGTVAPAKKGLSKDAVTAAILKLAREAVTDDEGMAQDVPFMEAGLDSLASVQFVTDVSREFSMSLPPSVIFDFPTGRALVDHIIEESSS